MQLKNEKNFCIFMEKTALKSRDTACRVRCIEKKFAFFTARAKKKRCRISKLSKSEASASLLATRRRTKVRREAKFAYSMNHDIFTI